MPESKKRQKEYRAPSATPVKKKGPSPAWLVPTMLVLFLVGIAWLVVYYIAPTTPFIDGLGGWNLLIGFGFIIGGFGLSTQWR